MRVEMLDWSRIDSARRNDWSQLVFRLGLNPSLEPDWMGAALESQGVAAVTSVFLAYGNGALAGVLPLTARRERVAGVALRALDVGSNFVSYHAEFVTDGGPVELLEAALGGPLRGDWDVLRVLNVPYPSTSADAIERWAASHRFRCLHWRGEESPYIAINTDWADYLGTRGKKFRANVQRALKRPQQQGHSRMAWFEAGADTDRLLADIGTIERASWKAREGLDIPSRERELDYHRRLLPMMSRSGRLLANVLYVEDLPVAYVLCCRARGWVGQMKTSFDLRARDAGSSAIVSSVMRAFELGAVEYDFLGEADPHKLKWTDRIRSHRNYAVYSDTSRGRAAGVLRSAVDRLKKRLGRGSSA